MTLLIMFDVRLVDKNTTGVLVLTLGLFLSDISEGTRKTKYTQNLSLSQRMWQNLKKCFLGLNQRKTLENWVNMCFWPKLKRLALKSGLGFRTLLWWKWSSQNLKWFGRNLVVRTLFEVYMEITMEKANLLCSVL